MKIAQINEIVNSILSVPNESYINRNTYRKGDFNITWLVPCSLPICPEFDAPRSTSYKELSICISNENNYYHTVYKITDEQESLLLERVNEIKDYIESNIFSIICDENSNC